MATQTDHPLASDHHHQQVDAETKSENQSHPSTQEDDGKEKLKPEINVVSETSPAKEEEILHDKTEEPSSSVETGPRQVEETVAEQEATSGSVPEETRDKSIEAETVIGVCEGNLEKEEETAEKPASIKPDEAAEEKIPSAETWTEKTVPTIADDIKEKQEEAGKVESVAQQRLELVEASKNVEEKERSVEPAKKLEEVAPVQPAETEKPASTEPAEASDEKIPSVQTSTEKIVPTVADDIKEKQQEAETVESVAKEKLESFDVSGSADEKEPSVDSAKEPKEVAATQPAETEKPKEFVSDENVSKETPAPVEAVESLEDKKLPAEIPAVEATTVKAAEREEKAKDAEAVETVQVGNPEPVELVESAEPKNPSTESSITTEANGIDEKQTESDAAENVAPEKLASGEVAESIEEKPPVVTAPVEAARSEDKTSTAEAIKVVSEEKPALVETIEPEPDQAVTAVAESVLKDEEKSTETIEATPKEQLVGSETATLPEQKPEPSKVEKEAPSEKQLPSDQTAVGAVSRAPENAQEEKPKVKVQEKLETEAVEVSDISKEERTEPISNEAEHKHAAESVGQVEKTAEPVKPDMTKRTEMVSETTVVEAAKDTVSEVSVNAATDFQEAKTENLEEKAEAKIEKTEDRSNIQTRDVEVIKKEDEGKVSNSKIEVAVESKESQPIDSKEKEHIAAQPPSAAETKKDDETKQTEQQTVQEVLVKSSKSSGNIISKVKQSIVKVKKAITGKSPASKTEAKVDQNIVK